MDKAEVSVIIPSYNSEDFLLETLHSLHNQTFQGIEILVIDDHSTDNTKKKINKFQQEYSSSIKLYENIGKGACAARNLGLKKSSGKYIQFLDADDLLGPDKIQQQVEALEKENAKLAVCETWKFKNKLSEAFNTDASYLFSTEKPEEFFINLWGGNSHLPNMVQTSAWLTPRNLIEKAGLWDETLEKDQDGEFFARVALSSNGIIYIPKIKNYYRIHSTGKNIASQKERKHLESQLRALNSKEYYMYLRTDSREFHNAMALQYKWIAVDSWPEFKDIHQSALKKMRQHGNSDFTPLMGGKLVELVKKFCGWKAAKIFSEFGRKVKRKIGGYQKQ